MSLLGLFFLIAILLAAKELFSEGSQAIGSGGGCGCLLGVFLILLALSFLDLAFTAPLGMLVVAIIIIMVCRK